MKAIRDFFDMIDRPGRVLLLFTGMSLFYVVMDALHQSSVTGSSLEAALLRPGTYNLVNRLFVVALAALAATATEMVLTQYRRAKRQLDAERRTMKSMYENNPSAIIGLDRDMRITYSNKRTESMVGRGRAELEGNRCYEAIIGAEEPCEGCLVPQVFETGEAHSRLKHERTIAGRENWLSQVWYPTFDKDGRVEQVVEIAADVSELRLDPLTSLPNRLLFRDRLDLALASAQRHGSQMGLLFLDIDDFKKVNDSLGHAAGDRLLAAFAERLRGVIRQDETLARLSGDEFVLLAPAVEGDEGLRQLADRILEQLETPFVIEGRSLQIGASIGGHLYTGDELSAQEILRAADSAMYEAKALGGSRYTASASR